jgi:hypothetical protein
MHFPKIASPKTVSPSVSRRHAMATQPLSRAELRRIVAEILG